MNLNERNACRSSQSAYHVDFSCSNMSLLEHNTFSSNCSNRFLIVSVLHWFANTSTDNHHTVKAFLAHSRVGGW
ncbi:hypothetical protein EG68_00892 [Paragonimus skrjabini miyazakii]|uniref:Uncharacterized protein n=1 Tax=Paragonimus skrjabini miyazakii TaxID=59628 RepID=A0A8S9Z4L1_9TREM|nr:hypothetical protein EG68_00892 [Paragonimus skrjabini miyazakii]